MVEHLPPHPPSIEGSLRVMTPAPDRRGDRSSRRFGVATGYKILTRSAADQAFELDQMMDDDVPGFGLLRPDRTERPTWAVYQSRDVA
jgi:hypothetical protein